MQRSAFESFHPWVIFGYLAAVLAVTMSTMHPVMIVTSFVISLVYSLFFCGRVVWKSSVMTGLGVAVFTMGLLPLFRHNGATPLFYINDMAVTRDNILFGGMMTLLLLAVLQWFYVWNELFGAEKIMYLIGRFFPAVSLVITMTLRYLPLLERRMDQIRAGERGMGSGSSVLRRLSVLLSWSLEDSIETSTAMETRGYGIGRRSSFHLFHFRKRDAVMLVVFTGLTAVIIGQFLRQKASCQYYPVIRYAPLGQMYLLPAGFGLLAMLPLVYDVWQWMVRSLEERKQGNTDAHIAKAQYLEQTYGVPYHERKARETREGEM